MMYSLNGCKRQLPLENEATYCLRVCVGIRVLSGGGDSKPNDSMRLDCGRKWRKMTRSLPCVVCLAGMQQRRICLLEKKRQEREIHDELSVLTTGN